MDIVQYINYKYKKISELIITTLVVILRFYVLISIGIIFNYFR